MRCHPIISHQHLMLEAADLLIQRMNGIALKWLSFQVRITMKYMALLMVLKYILLMPQAIVGALASDWLNDKFNEVIFGWHNFSGNDVDVWMDDIVVSRIVFSFCVVTRILFWSFLFWFFGSRWFFRFKISA